MLVSHDRNTTPVMELFVVMDIVEMRADSAVYTWDVYEILSYCFCLFIGIIGSWKGGVSVRSKEKL